MAVVVVVVMAIVVVLGAVGADGVMAATPRQPCAHEASAAVAASWAAHGMTYRRDDRHGSVLRQRAWRAGAGHGGRTKPWLK